MTFIRIGTSGAISRNVPLDSFVASQYALGLDGLLNFYDSKAVRIPDLEDQFDSKLNAYAVAADTDLMESFAGMTTPGLTITANGFYGPQGRAIRLQPKVDVVEMANQIQYEDLRPTNLEMETAGIYGMAALLGHRAISLNAILANRVNNTFSTEPNKTITKLISQSLEVISNL